MSTTSVDLSTYNKPAASPRASWLKAWLPVLLCMAVLAIESTAFFGSDHTIGPLQRMAEALFGSAIDPNWYVTHHIIRKAGHILGYGLFSLVCFRGFWLGLRHTSSRLATRLRAHSLAFLLTFLVAGADEFHQTFLPNRTGVFSDVMLDVCGALAFGLLQFFVMQMDQWRLDALHWADRRVDQATVSAPRLVETAAPGYVE